MSFQVRTPARSTESVMAHLDGKNSPLGFLGLPLFITLILFLAMSQPTAHSQEHPMDHEHGGMSMVTDEPMSAAAQFKLVADKKESEFNHHLAGFFVLLAAIFILFEERLKNRWPGVRFAWPFCFLLSGIFVLIFSDTELWPFGPKNWLTGVVGNLEVLQHKTFAVILLALGVVEMRRA